MFCRSFLPDKLNDVVIQWQTNLSEDKPDVAATLTCPGSHPEMWPLQSKALEIQKSIEAQNYMHSSISAGEYLNLKSLYQRDLFADGAEAGFDVETAPANDPVQEEEEVVPAAVEEVLVEETAEVVEDEPEEVVEEPEEVV